MAQVYLPLFKQLNPEYKDVPDDILAKSLTDIGDEIVTNDTQESSNDGDFVRGAKNDLKQLPAAGFGLLGAGAAVGENVFGTGGLWSGAKKAAFDEYKDRSEEISQTSKPTDDFDYSLDQAKQGNVGALVDFVQYGLGHAVSQLGQAALTGGAGASIAKYGAGKVAGELVAEAVAKESARLAATGLAANEAASQAAKIIAGKVAQIGATGAMLSTSLAQEGGEIGGGLLEKEDKRGYNLSGEELAKGFAYTLGAGGLEYIGDKLGLSAITGKLGFGQSSRAGRSILGGLTAATGEGVTEYGQTMLEEAGKGNDPFSEETAKQARTGAAMGFLGGGFAGGVGGLLSPNTAQDQPLPEESPETPSIDVTAPEVQPEAPIQPEVTPQPSVSDITSATDLTGAISAMDSFLQSPSLKAKTGFGALADFEDLIDTEAKDKAQYIDDLVNKQSLQRESNLETLNNTLGYNKQQQSQIERLQVLDDLLANENILDKKQAFQAKLQELGYNNTSPSDTELSKLATYDDLVSADTTLPSTPDEGNWYGTLKRGDDFDPFIDDALNRYDSLFEQTQSIQDEQPIEQSGNVDNSTELSAGQEDGLDLAGTISDKSNNYALDAGQLQSGIIEAAPKENTTDTLVNNAPIESRNQEVTEQPTEIESGESATQGEAVPNAEIKSTPKSEVAGKRPFIKTKSDDDFDYINDYVRNYAVDDILGNEQEHENRIARSKFMQTLSTLPIARKDKNKRDYVVELSSVKSNKYVDYKKNKRDDLIATKQLVVNPRSDKPSGEFDEMNQVKPYLLRQKLKPKDYIIRKNKNGYFAVNKESAKIKTIHDIIKSHGGVHLPEEERRKIISKLGKEIQIDHLFHKTQTSKSMEDMLPLLQQNGIDVKDSNDFVNQLASSINEIQEIPRQSESTGLTGQGLRSSIQEATTDVPDPVSSVEMDGKKYDSVQQTQTEAGQKSEDIPKVSAKNTESVNDVSKATVNRNLVHEHDSLLSAISKLGGLNTEEAKAQGIDPKMTGIRGHKISRVFTKKGKSYDEMAEILRGYGYEANDVNDLVDKVSRSVNQNEKIYTPTGYENVAKIAAEERLNDEQAQYVQRLESLYNTAKQHDDEFGTKWYDTIISNNDLDTDAVATWEQDLSDERELRNKKTNSDSEAQALSQYTNEETRQRDAAEKQRKSAEAEQSRRDEVIRADKDSGFDVFDEMMGNVPGTNDVFGMTNPMQKVERAESPKKVSDVTESKFGNTSEVVESKDNPYAEYNNTANQYGYSVDQDGSIKKSDGKDTGVKISVKKGRLRAESSNGDLIYSGANDPKSISQFLEKYWYAEKKTQANESIEQSSNTPTGKINESKSVELEPETQDPYKIPSTFYRETLIEIEDSDGNTEQKSAKDIIYLANKKIQAYEAFIKCVRS